LNEAIELSNSCDAVFNQNGKMAEIITMSPWVKDIIKRANIYGTA
jgi:hypothetical protein